MIKIKLHLLVAFFALFLFSGKLSAQCTGCTVTNPTGNYLFLANSVVCFTQNTTLGDVSFQDNVKVCIAPGVKLTITNNITTTAGHKLVFEIGGTLQINQGPTFASDLNINIATGGLLQSGPTGNNNFTFNGGVNNLINRGEVKVSVLQFQNGASTNIIDNFKTFTIGANINISGTTTFRNSDLLNIGGNYSNNANSLYINCGTINSSNGFNLGGGRILNTGNFNVPSGSIDMAAGSRIENYGNFFSGGIINGNSTSIFYNEGLARITAINSNGVTLKGPASNTKKGYFHVINGITPNGAKVGPNLDFKKYTSFSPNTMSGSQGEASVFSSPPVYHDATGNAVSLSAANVTFACSTCSAPVISTYACPTLNGTFAVAQVCVNPGIVNADPRIPTQMGITVQQKTEAWPQNVPNGFLALEANARGFVITRVAHVSSTPLPTDSVTDPREGMLVYDIQDQCVKLYNGTIWKCIVRDCNVL